MSKFRSTFYAIIDKGAEATLQARIEKLRKHAASYGWPSDITDQLKFSKGGTISYPEDIKEAVLTLEYGTQDVPPAPAIRTFMLGAK